MLLIYSLFISLAWISAYVVYKTFYRPVDMCTEEKAALAAALASHMEFEGKQLAKLSLTRQLSNLSKKLVTVVLWLAIGVIVVTVFAVFMPVNIAGYAALVTLGVAALVKLIRPVPSDKLLHMSPADLVDTEMAVYKFEYDFKKHQFIVCVGSLVCFVMDHEMKFVGMVNKEVSEVDAMLSMAGGLKEKFLESIRKLSEGN